MLAATTALAKPAKHQSTYGRTASGNTATTVANQWTSTTKAGSLLIAAITYTGGTGTTVTPPGGAGWTLISAGASNNTTNIGVQMFYIANAPAHTKDLDETFTLSPAAEAVLEFSEITGVQATSPLDGSSVSNGSTNPEALSVTTASDGTSEIAFGVWGLLSPTTTPGGATSISFTEFNSTGTGGNTNSNQPATTSTSSVHIYKAFNANTGSITSQISPTTPVPTWAGAIATFKVKANFWIGTQDFGTYPSTGYPARPMAGGTGCYGFYDDDACWSSTSGGSNDVTSPGSTDIVTFDGGGLGNVTFSDFNSNQNLAYSIVITPGYTGTLSVTDLAVNPDVSVTSTFVMNGGTFNVNGAQVSFTGATILGGSGATFSGGSGTESFGAALSVNQGAMTVRSATFTGVTSVGTSSTTGTLTLTSGAITLPNNLNVNGAGSRFNAGSAALSITGSTTVNTNGAFYGQSATSLSFGNNVTITQGTMDLSACAAPTFAMGTPIVVGSATPTTGVLTLNSGSVSLPLTLTVDGTGSQFNAAATTLTITGNATMDNGGTFNAGSGTKTFTGRLILGTTTPTSGYFNLGSATASFNNGTASVLRGASAFSGNTGSATFAIAPTLTSGTFTVGDAGTSGKITFTAGATFGSGTTLAFPSNGGEIQMPSSQALTMNGTVTSDVGVGSTLPKIDCDTGNTSGTGGTITVAFGNNSTLNLNGLEIDHSAIGGVTIGTGVTYTLFKRLKFQYAASGTPQHLTLTLATQVVNAPGCYFDASATHNVKLKGTSGAGNLRGARLILENQSTSTNGSGAGETLDDDSDTNDDGFGDTTVTPYFGSVIQWVGASPTDTAGTGVGYPTAAFDWNTFQWYGIYVAYKDATGTNTNDILWNRNTDGSVAYSYPVPDSSGNIVGTPWWDTVNELTAGVDANGDGDQMDNDVHVVYVATTTGHIIKLVDSGTSLAKPAMGAWSSDFTSANVSTITSPLIEDGTNLYFGGTDSMVNEIFGVQIVSGGSGEKALVREKATVGSVTAAPSWAVYSGHTYLLLGSAAVSSQAYVYQVDITANTIPNTFTGSTTGINDSVHLINNRAYAVTDAGKMFFLNASGTGSGAFTNLTGSPYTSAAASPIKFAPYVDWTDNNAYFGDNAGNLYVVTSAGANYAGYPTALVGGAISSTPVYVGTGVIAVGGTDSTGSFVFFVDRHNGSNLPALFKRYYVSASTTTVSSIAYDVNSSEYMVSSSDGKLMFIKASDVGDPTSSNQ